MNFTLILMTGPDSFEEYKNTCEFYVKEQCLHIIQRHPETGFVKRPIIIPNHAYMRAFESE